MLDIFPVSRPYYDVFMKSIYKEDLSKDEEINLHKFDFNIEEKIKQDSNIIKNMMLESETLKNVIKEFEEKYNSLLNKIEEESENLKLLMMTNKMEEIKTPYFKVKINKNPPSVLVKNEKEIPIDYIKETVVKTIDRKLILDHLKQGVIIDGAELQQKSRLVIK